MIARTAMIEAANANRPFQGKALAAVLRDLAQINAIALSLKYDLAPLSENDKALGMQPLAPTQISRELEHIAAIVTRIVLEHLKAESNEWYEANDQIE
ncbi:hypothetical protein QO002_006283 [Pararhizobium capsulatum DSM 1112]|uniref:Uncharacterized protein n=1 Tax=Pararhizobium capsulatum DSM 1112 TaxID=1121113 RepID=A0ABU0C0L9_9HYPH|nr:hypothetical protein [Pararhizobium capsulatum]MDQ0324076.1 hypothetical protein [Pararhizobium capsulatum DSM 1112]